MKTWVPILSQIGIESNKKLKRRIKVLKRSNKKSGSDNGDSDGDLDAGDEFGGIAYKRKKNES